MSATYYIRRDFPPVTAVEITKATDHPAIIVDPEGFEPARVTCHEPGTTAMVECTSAIRRGDILLLDPAGRPIRVVSKAEFAREYCELVLPDYPAAKEYAEG